MPRFEGSILWYPELAPAPDLVARRQRQLEESLQAEAGWVKDHYPAVDISVNVEGGGAVTLLSEKSRTAQLTVVGTRGHGTLASTLLGSVSRGLNHAEGPVMVVPNLADGRLTDREPFRNEVF